MSVTTFKSVLILSNLILVVGYLSLDVSVSQKKNQTNKKTNKKIQQTSNSLKIGYNKYNCWSSVRLGVIPLKNSP